MTKQQKHFGLIKPGGSTLKGWNAAEREDKEEMRNGEKTLVVGKEAKK